MGKGPTSFIAITRMLSSITTRAHAGVFASPSISLNLIDFASSIVGYDLEEGRVICVCYRKRKVCDRRLGFRRQKHRKKGRSAHRDDVRGYPTLHVLLGLFVEFLLRDDDGFVCGYRPLVPMYMEHGMVSATPFVFISARTADEQNAYGFRARPITALFEGARMVL